MHDRSRRVGRRVVFVLAGALTATCGFAASEKAFVDGGMALAGKRSEENSKRKARRERAEAALERARERAKPKRKAAERAREGNDDDIAPIEGKRDGRPMALAEKKSAVLAAPPEVLKRIGRHVITGYNSQKQLMPLLERGAIGGAFVTSRNVQRRNAAMLGKELKDLRSLADEAGQKVFWLATDQEGGSVSRLSPPLPYQASLKRVVSEHKAADKRRSAVEEYAVKQAKALADIGINLNFAPVADLNHNIRSSEDRHTRIRYRAVSENAEVVTDVGKTYCEALHKAGVYCTLKHFPGLGRVQADTHMTSARLKTSTEEMAKTDWVPFREIVASTPAFVMVGHQQMTTLDAQNPASTSPAVIQGVLRDEWKFDGIVITDDLSMGAITRGHKGGMGQAAIDALNAGADLVLIGPDGDQVYEVLYALILADEEKRLSHRNLEASDKRLSRLGTAATSPTPTASERDSGDGDVSKSKTARQ